MAKTARAYPGFRSMKRLGVFLLLDRTGWTGQDASPSPPQFVRFPQQFSRSLTH